MHKSRDKLRLYKIISIPSYAGGEMDKSHYICSECQHRVIKWQGKCINCGTWNSYRKKDEYYMTLITGDKKTPQALANISTENHEKITTNIKEFNSITSGGLTRSSSLLICGGPGIGKSTFVIQMLKTIKVKKILYISAEESLSQVKKRFERLEVENANIYLYNENKWENIKLEIEKMCPDIIIIDSIQMIESNDLTSNAGGINQLKQIAVEINQMVKDSEMVFVILGHINKDGQISGPKTLEHMVDVSMEITEDLLSHYRLLKIRKNRFGPSPQITALKMTQKGFVSVSDELSLEISSPKVGSATSLIQVSNIYYPVKIQTLVSKNKKNMPQIQVQGISATRIHMMLAILEKQLKCDLSYRDIFINVTGGLKIRDSYCDMALAASLISSYYDIKLSQSVVYHGEIGLSGEIRATTSNIKNALSAMPEYQFVIAKKQSRELKHHHKIKIIGLNDLGQLYQLLTNKQ